MFGFLKRRAERRRRMQEIRDLQLAGVRKSIEILRLIHNEIAPQQAPSKSP